MASWHEVWLAGSAAILNRLQSQQASCLSYCLPAGKVTEQLLRALGVEVCQDAITHRGLLTALLSPIACDFIFSAALGLGATRHAERPPENEPHRKGISVERTFRNMSNRGELEAMVSAACV